MSSLDYAAIAGLNILLSELCVKVDKSEEDIIVEKWIRYKIKSLQERVKR